MADAVALHQFREDRLRVIDAKSAGRFLYLSFVDAAGDEVTPEKEGSFVQTMELDCVTEKEARSNMKKLLKTRTPFSP